MTSTPDRTLLGDLPLELREEIGRDRVEAASEPHAPSSSRSSAATVPVQISCAGPVKTSLHLPVQLDEELAAREVNGDRAVAPAPRHRRACDGTGARAGGERLPRPALPDGDSRVAPRVDTHELHVRPLGKAGMVLDERAEPQELRALGISADDRVRVADGDGRELERQSVDFELLRIANLHAPHLGLNLEPSSHRCSDLPRADRHPDLVPSRLARQPTRSDPRPVSRELGRRAVRVPDHNVHARAGDRGHLEDPVRSDAKVVVT